MNQQTTTDVLNQITQKTNSDLIYFFVILAVIILAIAIPLYTLTIKENKAKRQQLLEQAKLQARREEQYIKVIEHNTDVNSQLKTMLEINNTNCIECKYEHQEKLEVLGEKLDNYNKEQMIKITSHNDKLVEVAVLLKQIIPIEFGHEAAATKEGLNNG
jgi:uncharacterized protein HemX